MGVVCAAPGLVGGLKVGSCGLPNVGVGFVVVLFPVASILLLLIVVVGFDWLTGCELLLDIVYGCEGGCIAGFWTCCCCC